MEKVAIFESKKDRTEREIKKLRDQLPDTNNEIKTEMNRFDLKLNNGGEINEEDVMNLFKGVSKKHKIATQMNNRLQEKGIDMNDVPALENVIEEVLEIEAWEERKNKKDTVN